MRDVRSIVDVNGGSSLEGYRLVNDFVAEKLGRFQSARMILYSVGSDETEPSEELRVLPGREQKWQ